MPIIAKRMGGNSKLEHWAITKTLDNGKLKIHDSSWEKVTFLGSGSFERLYKAITQEALIFSLLINVECILNLVVFMFKSFILCLISKIINIYIYILKKLFSHF